jgi:hypothetical protein
MKTFFDCLPCFVRQSLDSVRFVTPDESIHERVLREVLRLAHQMDLRQPPPVMAQKLHRRIRELTGADDPYREVKDRFNRLALAQYPEFRDRVARSADPMEAAVRLAIAGNVIDFGVNSHLTEQEVHDALMLAASTPLTGDLGGFCDAVARAGRVLYLADNAGEIVFDRLLIERISPERVTLVVKGAPIINDATMADAEAAGLAAMVEVIDNGSDAPGTLLDDCSEQFHRRFRDADLVIAKGQGNYESLSEADKEVWFLLKAKCPVIARDLGCDEGTFAVRRSEFAVR